MAAAAPAASLKGALLGMGNPLLDISAEVPMTFADKYGVKMNNAILAEEAHLPMYKEMVENFTVELIAGGATQNSIRVAQWMSGVSGLAGYIGCVGKDEFGAQLKSSASKDGVTTHYLEDEVAATGTCAVLVNEKERSLIANLSAANKYKIEHINSEPIQAVVKAASIYYSAGFFLTVSPASMLGVGKHAAATGKTFAMNLSAPFLCQVFKDQMHQVLPYADLVFGNESEAAAFAEANGFKDASVEEIAERIASLPKASGLRARTVVITQGSQPTVVFANGKVTKYPVTPIPEEELVDMNGAGDAFVGGFLAQLVKGAALDACVAAGTWAAGIIIRTSGCKLPETCDYGK